MSNNNFKYHILKNTVPDALLIANGYPIKECCNNSQGGSWVAFHGQKTTDIESVFDDHLVTDPPSYMTTTENMTQEQIKVIVRTRGATESDGWLAPLS